MNLENFTWLDRLKLAFAVLQDWRVIVTLVFFVIIIAAVRELSTLYKKKPRKKLSIKIPKPKLKKPKPVPQEADHDEAVEETADESEQNRR